jgi:hypothetical protein
MVELLDPQGTYFAGRIIAQGINAPPGEEPAPDVQFKRLMQVGGRAGQGVKLWYHGCKQQRSFR